MNTFFDKLFDRPIYVHLLAVSAALCIIIYIVLKWTDVYTRHNQAVHVPDVRGMQIEDAAQFFAQQKLSYAIVDSVFQTDVQPGAIVDLMPEADAKVKKNRTIYVTVNAKTEETIPVPEIHEKSFREAYLLLKARGFKNVEYKYVQGEFRNLTVGIEYEGQVIKKGDRVPLRAKLTLLVSNGNVQPNGEGDEDVIIPDTIGIITGDESWF